MVLKFKFILLFEKMEITEFYHRDTNLAQLQEIQFQLLSLESYNSQFTIFFTA